MDQGKELIRLALFGLPIKSSLSPSIHRMFADQFGLNIEYQRIEIGADGFPGALEAFRLEGGTGCNVTLPLKRDAWQLAAQSSPEAGQAQAANTLVYQPSSGWFAHNTDGAGLVADLAGNPRQVVLVNRNLDRARILARRFGTLGNIDVKGWIDLPGLDSFDVVINATSLGHHGEAPPLFATMFSPGAVCYDLNYFKASQPLKALCKDIGQSYIDGLGMLVEQAAKSFYIWTGKRPESRAVIENIRGELPG